MTGMHLACTTLTCMRPVVVIVLPALMGALIIRKYFPGEEAGENLSVSLNGIVID